MATGSSPGDISLPLDCPNCHGKIQVTYRNLRTPGGSADTLRNSCVCPHCTERVELILPGLVIPPIKIWCN